MSDLERLRQKIVRHSVVPRRSGARSLELVILVPRRADLGAAFERARARIGSVGASGVTLARCFPRSMRDAEGPHERRFVWTSTDALSVPLASAIDDWGLDPGL